MVSRRQIALGVAVAAAQASLLSYAQPSTIPHIGYLSSEPASAQTESANRLEALRKGLRDLGYVEGRTIVIEIRRADGNYDRLPDLAAQLVRLKVDVLVAEGIKAGAAAKRATTSIPIVVPATADPIVSGLATSLARPGGNVTGSAVLDTELAAKRLELLKEAVPGNTKVAFLLNPANPLSKPTVETVNTAANSLNLTVQWLEVKAPSEFDSVFGEIAKNKIPAVVVQGDTMFDERLPQIARLALAKRLALAGRSEIAGAGGLIGYGVNSPELYRRAASTVDKILKGAKAGELPFERASSFELVINLKTAKALGLTIPQPLLLRANDLIQ